MTYINTKQILTLSIEKKTYPDAFFIEILMTNGKYLIVRSETEFCDISMEYLPMYFSGEEEARKWLLSRDIINQLTRI